MLIIATTAKEMMQTGYRSSFYAYGDFQMFMARGFEFLVPPELIDSIVKSAYEQGFDESTEKFLRKLIVTWDDIFSKEKSYNLSPVLLFSIEGIPRQLTGTTLGSIAYFYLRKSAAQKK